jgi:beta-mannosidase
LPSIEPVTAQWQSRAAATVRLWAINDTWKPCRECRLSWRITQRDKVLAKGATTMTIAADSGTMVKAVGTPVGQDDVSIRFTIENSAGKIVGENQRGVRHKVSGEKENCRFPCFLVPFQRLP